MVPSSPSHSFPGSEPRPWCGAPRRPRRIATRRRPDGPGFFIPFIPRIHQAAALSHRGRVRAPTQPGEGRDRLRQRLHPRARGPRPRHRPHGRDGHGCLQRRKLEQAPRPHLGGEIPQGAEDPRACMVRTRQPGDMAQPVQRRRPQCRNPGTPRTPQPWRCGTPRTRYDAESRDA